MDGTATTTKLNSHQILLHNYHRTGTVRVNYEFYPDNWNLAHECAIDSIPSQNSSFILKNHNR